jgi:transposase
LTDLVTHQPTRREVHVILDNLSAHKTKLVQAFLAAHPRVHLHFTPTYSSWLNQVELWFAKIERDVIARGIFTSVKDLARKLMRDIRLYNQTPKPVKWRYSDLSNRITTTSGVPVQRPGEGRLTRVWPPVAPRLGPRAGQPPSSLASCL